MGSPYIKPVSAPGYNNNPPPDDNSQVPENQLQWQKHLDKIGDPLKTHTEGEADATENAFNVRLLNNTIVTTVNYTVNVGDRGKIITATTDAVQITLPDATAPNVTDGFEVPVYALITTPEGDIDTSAAIKIVGTGGQTVNGFADWPLKSGEFALCSSAGGNWTALASYYAIPPDPSVAFSFYGESATLSYTPASFVDVPFASFTPALPSRPKLAIITPICTTAGLGYAVGDEPQWMNNQIDGFTAGLQCAITSTNVRALYGPNGYILIQGVPANISLVSDDSIMGMKIKAWG